MLKVNEKNWCWQVSIVKTLVNVVLKVTGYIKYLFFFEPKSSVQFGGGSCMKCCLGEFRGMSPKKIWDCRSSEIDFDAI